MSDYGQALRICMSNIKNNSEHPGNDNIAELKQNDLHQLPDDPDAKDKTSHCTLFFEMGKIKQTWSLHKFWVPLKMNVKLPLNFMAKHCNQMHFG